jgi:tetratricopeptide (TPR) repeat protein
MKCHPIKSLAGMVPLLLGLSVFVVAAQATSPQETLNQYIADLRKNPNDYALREKIIKHVQTMKPAPAVPDEAKRHLVRGKAAFNGAKEARDFQDAADEFKKALLYAPWLAEGYYNLGVIQDKAGQYDDAMKNLKFYLIAAPKAPDTEKVKELVYEIEYRKEKAAKDKDATARKAAEDSRAQQEAAARKQQEFLNKINGARYAYYFWGNRGDTGARAEYIITLDVRGDTMTQGQGLANGRDWSQNPILFKIDGRTLRCFINGRALPENDGVISDDGNTITVGQGAVFKRVR